MGVNGSNLKNLSPDQVQALAALLTEKDVKSAAAKAGCGETTLHRWLREDEDFKAALQDAEVELIDQAVRRLAGAAPDAVNVLVATMNNRKVSPAVKVRAARVVIDQLVKLREWGALEERLALMEEMLNGSQGR